MADEIKCKLHNLVEDIFACPCKLSAFIKALSTVNGDQLDFKKYINEGSSVCVIKIRSGFFFRIIRFAFSFRCTFNHSFKEKFIQKIKQAIFIFVFLLLQSVLDNS